MVELNLKEKPINQWLNKDLKICCFLKRRINENPLPKKRQR